MFTVALLLAAAPGTRQDVFRAGENGYALYRIPGLVVTAKGSLLAYCEARKTGASDWGEIMPVCRRSADGGATWSDAQPLGHKPPDFAKNPVALAKKVGKPDDVTIGNPVMIADPTGPVHLVYTVETMRAFYRRSDDDGQTWTPPVEITSAAVPLKAKYDWKVIAPGPGHGIRHSKTGRLIVPVWLSLGTGGNAHRPSVVSTLYSDDAGKTWAIGDIAAPDTPEFVNPNETEAVELSDGRVMLNVRNESKRHRRLVVVGPNGATGWTQPRFQDDLVEPICFGSIVRFDAKTLLFSHPANLLRGDKEGTPGQGRDRKRVTVFVSTDDGTTWPKSVLIDDGWSGYSDLAAKDGVAYCLYERGAVGAKAFHPQALTLVTLTGLGK